MSNRRKPRKPWLTMWAPGESLDFPNPTRKMNRRRLQMLRRRLYIHTLIEEGKMK